MADTNAWSSVTTYSEIPSEIMPNYNITNGNFQLVVEERSVRCITNVKSGSSFYFTWTK